MEPILSDTDIERIATAVVIKLERKEVLEDTYISVSEAKELIGVKMNQTVIGMCERGILKFTYILGKEREDGKSPKKTRLISKQSVIKFIKNKR